MSSRRVMWFLLACAAIPTGASAENRYQQYFQNAYRACSDRFPPDTVSASIDYAAAREDCYFAQVQRALAQLPPETPKLLASALQAVPDYAHVTFDAALKAGVDPYYAVTAATTSMPEYASTFASQAIRFGADPSQVTEATAAGYQQKKH